MIESIVGFGLVIVMAICYLFGRFTGVIKERKRVIQVLKKGYWNNETNQF